MLINLSIYYDDISIQFVILLGTYYTYYVYIEYCYILYTAVLKPLKKCLIELIML